MKNVAGILALLVLIPLAVTAHSCGKGQSVKDSKPATVISPVVGGGGDEVVFNYDGEGTVGVLHFAQIRQAMSAVTGVSPTDNQVANFYDLTKARYSTQGNVETISPAMLLATTAMAGVFCSRLIAAEKLLAGNARKVFNAVNFTVNQTGLNAQVRGDVFQRLAQAFWRRAPNNEELQILNTTVDEGLTGRPNSVNETTNAMLVACTAALSSVDFIQN